MAAKGFRKVHLMAAEHIPLAPCHSGHLNETLPELMASMPEDLCILLSTCARYHPVAHFTRTEIQRQWKETPPVYLCGVVDPDALPLRDDPSDWMAVVLSAVEDLIEKGFVWTYLILDDHPPLGACRADYLNSTLPRIARERNAAMISLLGWGQRREIEGQDLGRFLGHLSQNALSYRWKFSLHPALWNLSCLAIILRIRMKQYPPDQHTPWRFERHQDEPGGELPTEILEGTYRIHGHSVTGIKATDSLRAATLFGFDVVRFLIRIFCGNEARMAFDRNNLWLYHFYNGPYPIFWSGTMLQGRPSVAFRNFLKWTGRRRLASNWAKISRKLDVGL